MALFKRFFYRKPPDRLFEISERVYVFDCCFSTDVLEEDEYKVYMGGIVAELQDYYPDSSFMVFNFREGDRRTRISDILSQYDMTIMQYPRQYGGCPVLPLEMIHHFLRSSESWLSLADQQNVLLMHCEMGAWPVLAFMLAALLLFRKEYSGEQKTLEMVYKQAPRELRLLTPFNPQPSQLRYLQYISRRNLGSDWSPSDTPLTLDHIKLKSLPLFGEKGCRPVIRIYGQDSSSTTANKGSKLLFTSSKTEEQDRYYQSEECELVEIDIHHCVQGDVVLECAHLDHVSQERIFRVMFHTTFVRNGVLILNHDEVDIIWDARDLIPKNFRAEVCFSNVDELPSMITTHEEYFEVEELFSRKNLAGVISNQEEEDSAGKKLSRKESDELEVGLDGVANQSPQSPPPPPPPPPQSPPPHPPATYAAPFPQIMGPFLKEFEHLKIQLEDIKSATDNFGVNKLIGSGGFGRVYRGEVSHSNGKSMCAFKRLDPKYGQGEPEFLKEIMMLSDYKHANLISLLGYCDEGGEKILVYEYASNGSLDRHLSSNLLTWGQRIKICVDAARGLSFLHDDKGTKQRVLHRDIKSANILLDDNWNAKVSDMGLSRLGPANQRHTVVITRSIVGTPGYCDPQYLNSFTLSKESDVYSFGVVLFEVLCGKLCFNNSNGQVDVLVPMWKKAYKQKRLHEIVFQGLTRPMDSTSLETFSCIAFQCLHKSREERPKMADVVEKLETALEFEFRSEAAI
ncbi:putative protein kinase RLK-Pelle-CrRLK1L-1 family [Helianthus annuus]|uniref:Putative tensin phosphatase, C2 domain-containing protein n=1 Tax=Helianthus annuus TaxID=4232 RepID=A0A251RWH3_HELAN|nr:formin-like protein 20 [Helianthus annuus]KAF5758439.1 putative protein kinase RLK-Pelle-CrRLK1L-1 family [Helianthus annuus]KAJ0436786.1 putative protein kinase RLK-Pelle-CrRLK1L-1 family [Helianthus annuus]KAJ0441023.1 putative protein kinase RLK-Pelle-CrRLK1L-1 family [Helianthus annuus]KAJ0459083.1 putative protein kinase RLK-Pelle-CrRLK1L-1 family [Helianthus annuus]KAJ0639638.1 putative protein kinase RLK-Pelle-CrRLK1L-1 family [Helianthus annuus]